MALMDCISVDVVLAFGKSLEGVYHVHIYLRSPMGDQAEINFKSMYKYI